MQEFVYLDYVLLASGCKVFRKNSSVRILNILMLFLIIICYGATLFHSIESTLTSGGLVILVMMSRYSHELCGLTFIAVLSYYRFSMRRILILVAKNLTASQKSCLKRHGLVFLVLLVMTILQDAVITHLHLNSRHGRTLGPNHRLMDWLKCYHNMNSWFYGGVGVYTFFVKMIRFNEINYFDAMAGKHELLIPGMDSFLALERRSVALVKKRLMKTLAFVPCLWVVNVFVRAPVVVFKIAQPNSIPIGRIFRTLPLIYQLIALAYVVYECEICNLTVGKRVNDLLVAMMEENRIQDMDLFVQQLQRSADDDFSSWKTISLNRRFYLGFLCSVVSFTVLFIEVTQDVTGTNDLPVLPIVPTEATTEMQTILSNETLV